MLSPRALGAASHLAHFIFTALPGALRFPAVTNFTNRADTVRVNTQSRHTCKAQADNNPPVY